MTRAFEDRKDPLAARGVLLIDEMDLHLHPVWKRQLVDFIDAAFPNLQIIATTHSPLSVQQCGEGELFVVRREAGRPTLISFKGDPRKLRLSDLFLSPLIGLETLDSPKVAELRERARAIEMKPGLPTPGEATTLRQIRKELGSAKPIAVAEAPALESFIRRSQSQLLMDPLIRIVQAEALFGKPVITVRRAAARKMRKASAPGRRQKATGSSKVYAKVAKKGTVRKAAKKVVASKKHPKATLKKKARRVKK